MNFKEFIKENNIDEIFFPPTSVQFHDNLSYYSDSYNYILTWGDSDKAKMLDCLPNIFYSMNIPFVLSSDDQYQYAHLFKNGTCDKVDKYRSIDDVLENGNHKLTLEQIKVIKIMMAV